MRRGRLIGFLATVLLLAAVAGWGGAAVARADGTPQDICADLQDGKVDGSYTAAEWQAFLADPTVQGYCSVIVPQCVVPTAPGCSTTPPCTEATGGTGTGDTGGTGGTTCSSTPPCTETTGGTGTGGTGTGGTSCSTTPPTTPPVPLTPPAVAGVAGATHTESHPATPTKPTPHVLGAKHTQTGPAPKQAVAPVHAVQAGGTLPFTGLQLGLFVAVGLVLVGVGFTLRRAGRTSSSD
jgi:hypothetical protein